MPMSLTNFKHAGHRLLRVVSSALRVVLPVLIGLALPLGYGLLLFGAPPAVRTGGQVPAGYMQVAQDGWTMTVPASWEIAPRFKPDSPSSVVGVFASSKPVPTSGPEQFPQYRESNAELSLYVSRTSRDGRDLDSAVGRRDSCFRCSPVLRTDRRAMDVRGRYGILTDVARADGSREWTLVVQNDCYTYRAHATLVAAWVPHMSKTVEQVLASAVVNGSGKLLKWCP